MIQIVQNLIKECNNIVVLSGLKLVLEAGLYGVRQEERAYDIEAKFGFSPEEIATTEFLNRRVDLFYRYYKEEILDLDKMVPTPSHYAIAKLEQQGKLLTVVTRTIYGLFQSAGVHNIIELHGNANENTCPKCGRHFPADYIANSKGVPVCENCKVVLRPGFALFGEAIDNGKISMVADQVSKADMVIVAGTTLDSYLARYALQYYQGDKLVLIHDIESLEDKRANYVIYGSCKDILPQIIV